MYKKLKNRCILILLLVLDVYYCQNIPEEIAVTIEDEPSIEEGAEGYKARTKCREYLQNHEISIPALAKDDAPITVNITTSTKNEEAPIIVGGQIADPGEFPFIVAIGWPEGDQIDYKCGGTLISNQYVLTTAHCTYLRGKGQPTVARIGATNERPTHQSLERNKADVYKIADIMSHEEYTGITHYNDIALIKLQRNITHWTKNIRPACLWTKSSFDSTKAIAAGWGHLEEAGEESVVLQKVALDLFPNSICEERYKNLKRLPQGTPDSIICSGHLAGGRDICQGNTGGPLIKKKTDGSSEYYLIGITSFGIGCAKVQTPGVYTRVSSYIGWIEKTVWS